MSPDLFLTTPLAGPPPEVSLRDYQHDLVAGVRRSLATGHRRPLAQLPTGGGKTRIAASMISGALRKGRRATFVVPALSLVDQTVEAFREVGLNDIGVIQADHALTDPDCAVQVASVQTLARRRKPATGLVIVDEAHKVFEVIPRWMADAPELPFIGLSATPWTRGLGKVYDDLIAPLRTGDLIGQGYLSPFRVFAPSHPDLTNVRKVAGDYREDDLAKAMNPLVADVVSTWLERGEGRPTLCFAVDRAHAKHLQQQFQAAGVSTGYVDAYTDLDEREAVRRAFHDGELKVVCNVGVLTTGVDWDVRCIILARPTQSEMLYVQIIGRGLRTAEGKADCLILDHSDTTVRLGFVTDIHHDELDGGKLKGPAAKQERKPVLPKECPQCSYLRPTKQPICPACGHKVEFKGAPVDTGDGELIELDGRRLAKLNREAGWPEKTAFMAQLERHAEATNKSPGWVGHAYKEKLGVWPNDSRVRSVAPATFVDPAAAAWIRAKAIRYAKRRAA